VADFLVALFQQSDPLVQTDSNPRIQDLLDRAYEEIRIGFSADSQIKGNLQLTLARALMEFNQTKKATVLLEECAALGLPSLPSGYSLLRAQVALQACDFAGCQQWLDQARSSAEAAADVEAQVKILYAQAELYRETSQFPQAVATLDSALALQGYPNKAYWRIRLLAARGNVRCDALELAQGLADIGEAERLVQDSLGSDSPAFAQLQLARAAAYTQAGQYEKGLELNRAALPVIERILGKDHPIYAEALHDAGAALSGLGRLDEALEPLQQALALRTASDGTRHAQAVAHLSEIGLVYSRKQDLESAINNYRQAVDLAITAFPPGKLERIVAQVNLGSALDQAGQPEHGLPLLQEAYALTKDNPSTVFYRGVAALLLGRTLQTLNRHAEALPVLEESLVLVSRYPDQLQIPRGVVNIRLAKAARSLKMEERACQEWRSAYEDLLKTMGAEHPWTRLCLTEMQACNP
jgi:tetratricopeptide (TPR) repeat protein